MDTIIYMQWVNKNVILNFHLVLIIYYLIVKIVFNFYVDSIKSHGKYCIVYIWAKIKSGVLIIYCYVF